MNATRSLALQVEAELARFVAESPDNRLAGLDGAPIFDAPLVGYAAGDDPLFGQYKQIIGESHHTPREMVQAAGQVCAPDHALTVISWILPITASTRESNRQQTTEPSAPWIHTRHHGEYFNDVLRAHMVAWLRALGYLAVAPVLAEAFVIHWEGVDQAPRSTWSERHVAYAAGLGSFGLSRGLITARGIAMRCGSVVTDLAVPPSPRLAQSPYDNCPYLISGACGACIARCPAGAITPAGMDKQKCYRYQRQTLGYLDARYPGWSKGCGLCQVGVPCEDGIPD